MPPAQRTTAAQTYFSLTKSLCRICKNAVDAKIRFHEGAVYFDKFCPVHGHQEALVASSAEWYLDCLSFVAPCRPPREARKPVSAGCPFDCGPCASHQQKVYLPVVPIISGCNLDCPICYTVNKNEGAYQMSRDELRAILQHLKEDHEELDIINFTGGEPTLHPDLPGLLELCREAGIERLTISTNGLKLRDENLVRRLAELDARVVLSLDTFNPETDRALLGANTVATKLAVLDLLEQHGVTTTILPAVAAGYNDREVGALLDLVLQRRNLLSLELHTLCFTGQGGVGFQRNARITIPDLHRRMAEHTGGRITARDFVPSPLAHPHCYSICYLLCLEDGGYVPFTRFMPRAELFGLLEDSLYLEPRPRMEEVFRDVIDRLFAEPGSLPESEQVLRTLKNLIARLFPADGRVRSLTERRRIAERSAKAIYIHSHMDEETFDVGRVMKCCVGVPAPDGTNIPTCSYNVIYREKDPRFAAPAMLERMQRSRPASSSPMAADGSSRASLGPGQSSAPTAVGGYDEATP